MEAEQAVLGGVLLDNGAWDRIADILAGTHFYRGDHRAVFNGGRGLVRRGAALRCGHRGGTARP